MSKQMVFVFMRSSLVYAHCVCPIILSKDDHCNLLKCQVDYGIGQGGDARGGVLAAMYADYHITVSWDSVFVRCYGT